MNIIYRQAEIKDSEILAKLSMQLGYQSTEENILNRLITILGNNDNYLLVAENGNNVIGWIHGYYSLRIESEPFVEIGGMVVKKDFRRLGIGKNLIEKTKEWAESKNVKKLRVRCNVIRKETHKFYEKLGFNEIKEQKIFDMNI